MSPDEIVRRAALLLRSGAVPVSEFVGALDKGAKVATSAALGAPLCWKCAMRPAHGVPGGGVPVGVCCCGLCFAERPEPRASGVPCADCPLKKGLGKCFAGACAVPATRYANGHALCERHAAEVDERQVMLRHHGLAP